MNETKGRTPFLVGSISREDIRTLRDNYGLDLSDEQIEAISDETMKTMAESIGEVFFSSNRFWNMLAEEVRYEVIGGKGC